MSFKDILKVGCNYNIIFLGYDPIEVYCSFDNDNGVVTEIKHFQEKVIEVEKCDTVACFTQAIRYGVPLEQIYALTTLSEHCEQSIAFGCFLAPLLLENQVLGGWLDRNGN